VLVENVLQFKHSAFQQVRRRVLPRSAILGRAAILSNEKDDVFRTERGGGAASMGREEMDMSS
jgi:hypothetical protein